MSIMGLCIKPQNMKKKSLNIEKKRKKFAHWWECLSGLKVNVKSESKESRSAAVWKKGDTPEGSVQTCR